MVQKLHEHSEILKILVKSVNIYDTIYNHCKNIYFLVALKI